MELNFNNLNISELNKGDFLSSYFKFTTNKYLKKLLRRNVFRLNYGKELLDPTVANDHLYQLIKSGTSFIAGRFGTSEMNLISQVIKNELKLGKIRNLEMKTLVMNAGFFPGDLVNFRNFAFLNLDLCYDIDMLGILNSRFEDYVVRTFMKEALIADLRFIEPYYFKNPWSRSLEGKKVLVIHPFSETISEQYKKRQDIFENKDVLPQFELITLKAIQTIAGNKSQFQNWFDALNYMFEKAMSKDFEVAIIGCGAYGLPLAIKLKQVGKQAIHMGGATQILFGIKGARWDYHPIISKLYNQNWVRPAKSEIPERSYLVEESCYW